MYICYILLHSVIINMNNLIKNIENKSLDILTIENISAYDVLSYFNANIFPTIKDRYFWFSAQTKRSLVSIFSKKQSKNNIRTQEQNINELFWIEIAKSIFELVVGDNINDFERINLFLQVMYLEMTTTAYLNAWCDFNNCAKLYEKEWKVEKSKIIQESLKLCDKKFWKGIATIRFTEDHIIFESGYWTTIQHKDDIGK